MREADAPPPLADLADASLFLDFDGTLVALADRPDGIEVPRHLPSLLDRVAAALDGRLAILTGRALADLDRHLAAPHLAAAGSHGLELRGAAAQTEHTAVPSALVDARAALAAFAAGA